MNSKTIEAIIASPPERDELVVQLFQKDGAQFGEIFRRDGTYLLELYSQTTHEPWQLDPTELQEVLALSVKELKARLGDGKPTI